MAKALHDTIKAVIRNFKVSKDIEKMTSKMRRYKALMSNLAKTDHDVAMAAVRNTRASKDIKQVSSIKNKTRAVIEAYKRDGLGKTSQRHAAEVRAGTRKEKPEADWDMLSKSRIAARGLNRRTERENKSWARRSRATYKLSLANRDQLPEDKLNEIGREKLGRYIKQASREKSTAQFDLSQNSMVQGLNQNAGVRAAAKKAGVKAYNTFSKRSAGIDRATDNLVKEKPPKKETPKGMYESQEDAILSFVEMITVRKIPATGIQKMQTKNQRRVSKAQQYKANKEMDDAENNRSDFDAIFNRPPKDKQSSLKTARHAKRVQESEVVPFSNLAKKISNKARSKALARFAAIKQAKRENNPEALKKARESGSSYFRRTQSSKGKVIPFKKKSTTPGWELRHEKTGKVHQVGDEVSTRRDDEKTKITGLVPPRHAGSSGHVTTDLGHHYASVYDMKWHKIKEETQKDINIMSEDKKVEDKKSEETIQDVYAKAISSLIASESHLLNPGPYGRTIVKKPEEKDKITTEVIEN